MEVREVDLPGVGRKFALVTNQGERLTVIIHNTGDRELYNFREDEDFPFHALRLEDDEARKLSAILGGAYFQPTSGASVDLVFEQLSIEWLKVGSESRLAQRTIGELDIRKNTGASVLALLRGKQVIANPQPDERIEVGDTVMVAGAHDQVNRFLAFSRGEQ
jgi:K+:H+ antiporter subunit KhtT